MTASTGPKCPKCGGTILYSGFSYKCIACGHSVKISEHEKKKGTKRRNAANKK